MDYKAEQEQELEILASIYPDELTILNEDQTRFEISVLLDTDSETRHAVKLEIAYPDQYPDEVPDLDVVGCEADNSHLRIDYIAQGKELEEKEQQEEDDNFAGSQKLVNLIERIRFDKTDYKKLADMLREEALENIGMPSVFSLASSLKDHAEQLFQHKFELEEKAILDAREQKEQLEQAKFNGTKVTVESFAAWRAKFRAEPGMDDRLNNRYQEMHAGKLTGKEIWDRGLATGDDLADDEAGDGDKDVDFRELRDKMNAVQLS